MISLLKQLQKYCEMSDNTSHPATIAAQAGGAHDPATGGVVPAIQPSTTFKHGNDFLYSRYGHPNVSAVEKAAAHLDDGASALAFSSGMAAVSSVIESMSMGGLLVAPEVMYHGAQDWFRTQAAKGRIKLRLFDSDRPGALEEAVTTETEILWIETPTNPMWGLIDIRAAAGAAHAVGAALVVDSTVAPPVTTKPLELGADIVFHSATKYYNGHSDVLAGILVTVADDERWNTIAAIRDSFGSILAPFEAWLLLRGIRTMPLRFSQASQSAATIADTLVGHRHVDAVLYPGLADHPGHDIATRQMSHGFGAMLSLLVNGGAADAIRVAEATRLFVNATSLGGVESLIEHRASVQTTQVPENLLRVSVGIEHTQDLVDDLTRALDSLS